MLTKPKKNKENVLAIMLDLSKAFDTIQHDLLLHKLQYYGIRGTALKWFSSYLTNRKQYVELSTKSKIMNIKGYGVPQGSVLGPLLFIIYINDIHKALKDNSPIQFADDTKVYFTHSNVECLYQIANKGLNQLADWFKANKLSLNTKKTKHILISNAKKSFKTLPTIQIGIEEIVRVNHANFLGIHIDEKLEWEAHINHCKNKVSSGIYALNMIKKHST